MALSTRPRKCITTLSFWLSFALTLDSLEYASRDRGLISPACDIATLLAQGH